MKSIVGLHRPRSLSVQILGLLLAAWIVPVDAVARTFAFPHVFDQKGRISNTPYTFDTTMFLTYVGGTACVGDEPDQNVELYLFADDGSPLRSSTGADVCAPCTFPMGSTRRSTVINLEDVLATAGDTSNFVFGHGLIVVPSDKVSVQGYVVNSHATPGELSVMPLTPTELPAAWDPATGLPCGRVFVGNQWRQSADTGPGTTYTFDTTMFMTYSAGRGGLPPGSGATVDIYLYDEMTGDLLADAVGGPVCDPCTINLDATAPRAAFSVGAAIPGAGIVSAAISSVCVVSGDAGNVGIQTMVVNRLSSPSDVIMYSPPLQEITAATASSVPADLAERLGLRSYPNPFNPLTTFAYTLAAPDQVAVRVFDAHGAVVRTLLQDGQDQGEHQVTWDGRDDRGRQMPSGVYFGQITTSQMQETQKVMLVK